MELASNLLPLPQLVGPGLDFHSDESVGLVTSIKDHRWTNSDLKETVAAYLTG
jgi:hypothetical protein